MRRSTLLGLASCLAVPLLLTHCVESSPDPSDEDGGSSGSSGKGSGGTTGGVSASGGSGGATGGTGGGTTGGTGGGTTGGTGGATGGTPATGGAGGATGGTPATGGAGGVTGGAAGTGGVSPTGGTGGALPSGGAGAGGSTAGSGATTQGGSTSSGGAPMGGGPNVDQNGVGLARPGDQKTGSREYLRLGDMRLLNNKWGSDELGCNTSMRVFVNSDRTVGWDFNRATCGGMAEKPDYPEIEFGVHPFGAGNVLETSPPFSSTLLLPKQIKDITSASVTLDSLHIGLQNMKSWNINFEFWLSQRNPLTDPNPGVYAELITFFGWQNGRWPCDMTGDVTAGDRTYHLCHQDDNWADGKWRYYQFWVNGGPFNDFSGKVDVKALLNYLVNQRGYSPDLWVTRFEIGSEIDDQTSGTVTLRNVTFEVNNTSKSIELAP